MAGRAGWLLDSGVTTVRDLGDLVGGLEVFRQVGFRNERIVELATVDAADALGLADKIGRLAPGHRADVLVVEGDPVADLAALRDVRLVLAGGEPHVPASAPVSHGWPRH